MKFDIQKELGMDDMPANNRDKRKPDNFKTKSGLKLRAKFKSNFLIFVFIAFSVINFVFIIIVLLTLLFSHNKNADQHLYSAKTEEVNNQMFDHSEARFSQLEKSVNSLHDIIKKQNEDAKKAKIKTPKVENPLAKVAAQAQAQADNDEIVPNIPFDNNQKVQLSFDEEVQFNNLIDEDNSGTQVKNLVQNEHDTAKRDAYIQDLKYKGNDWFDVAIEAIRHDDDDWDVCVENANYFYDILNDVSDDNSLQALVQSKQTQLEIAIQNQKVDAVESDITQAKDQAEQRDWDSKARERWIEKRRAVGPVKSYESRNLVKPYKKDWDSNPSVREERGISD